MLIDHDERPSEWQRVPIYAILLFQLAALITRSFIDVQLRDKGFDPQLAENLSYLVVPPLLLVFMLSVWKHHGDLIKNLFRTKDLNWRVTGIGLMLALAIWFAVALTNVALSAHEVAVRDYSPRAISLDIAWLCGQYLHMFLGIAVTVLFIPVIEEAFNRGFILHYFLRRGKLFAVLSSALIFALLHEPQSLPLTFVAGIYFAYLTLHHSTLWPATIAHSVYNLFVQIDESCLTAAWTNSPTALDASTISFIAAFGAAALMGFGGILVSPKCAGAR